jgi:hypothetical protein
MSFHAKQQSQRQTILARASQLEEPPSSCPASIVLVVDGWHLLSFLAGTGNEETWLAWGEGPSPLPRMGSQGPDPLHLSFLLRLQCDSSDRSLFSGTRGPPLSSQ